MIDCLPIPARVEAFGIPGQDPWIKTRVAIDNIKNNFRVYLKILE